MTTTLDVVNSCLATMGESPLNTLLEPHEFKGSAQQKLAEASTTIQSRGWWYNKEEVTFSPNSVNGQIQLPGDCLGWQSGVLLASGAPTLSKPWIVQRGKRLYDVRERSFVITETVQGTITRLVPFEDLPPVMADYIAAEAIMRFQSDFDSDNGKQQRLAQNQQVARIAAVAEQTRQLKVNLVLNNTSLQRIKSRVRGIRS